MVSLYNWKGKCRPVPRGEGLFLAAQRMGGRKEGARVDRLGKVPPSRGEPGQQAGSL